MRATSDRRGTSVTFRSHGPNKPDLRAVLPDLLQARPDPIEADPPRSDPPRSDPPRSDPPRSNKLDCLRLGTFEVTGGAIRCTDPCYEPGTWCAREVRAAGGTWQATAFVGDLPDLGKSVHRLRVDHTSLPAHATGPIHQVGVDSGQFGFFDAVRYPIEPGNYDHPRSLYGRACRTTLRMRCGMMNEGVVSESGLGDGGYELSTWVDRDGLAVAIEVIFIDEDPPTIDIDIPDIAISDLQTKDPSSKDHR